jgi:hypothetical protein
VLRICSTAFAEPDVMRITCLFPELEGGFPSYSCASPHVLQDARGLHHLRDIA